MAILTEVADPGLPGEGEWTVKEFLSPAQLPKSIEQVLSLGAFCALSGRVKPWATKRDIRFSVVQHGLMTPWAPPLSDGDHLLAWSEADGHYWSADRPSITWEVVGPQMLWEADQQPRLAVADDRPIMLGQLHGIELDRMDKLRVYRDFCSDWRADYRPHPNESDVLSKAGHAWLRRRGVAFEASGRPVTELARPVVSIFSTGTLEAAQRGLPAWVHHPDPPSWVADFWGRYGLSPSGSAPTKPWQLGDVPPSVLIARAAGLTN